MRMQRIRKQFTIVIDHSFQRRFRCLAIISFLIFHCQFELHAQKEASFLVYHGDSGNSVIFGHQVSGGEFSSRGILKDPSPIVLPVGCKVRIRVVNANPYLYSYSIGANEDSSKSSLPDLSGLVALLNTTISNGMVYNAFVRTLSGKKEKESDSNTSSSAWATEYLNAIKKVMTGLQEARKIIAESDKPECFSFTAGQPCSSSVDVGFSAAQSRLYRIGGDDQPAFPLFGMSAKQTPAEFLAAAYEKCAKGLPTDDENAAIVLGALKEFSGSLLEAVKSINEKFLRADPTMFTFVVKEKAFTLSLDVASKTMKPLPARDTGKGVVTLTIVPKFNRSAIELMPMTYITTTFNVPKFSVKNGIVVKGEGETTLKFGAGGVLLFNALNWGQRDERSFGPFLGYGVSKEKKFDFSNVLLGLMFSFEKDFRIGGGFGVANVPMRLPSTLEEGKPLPSSVENLDDVLEYGPKGSFFITISMTGLSIP